MAKPAYTTHIGCSGYHYKDWLGQYYPVGLPASKWLPYYAQEFDTVEINNTFYQFPKASTLQKWYGISPPNFLFTLKGNRYITHLKQLHVDQKLRDGLTMFYDLAAIMQEKIGCVLWQLPGRLQRNDEKLERFCQQLSKAFINVIEFRHDSWFTEPVYDILRKHNVVFCIISAPGLAEPVVQTHQAIYVRFHGKTAWYDYLYTQAEMEDWAKRIKELQAKQIFVYFNNDWHTHAITNARMLDKLL